MSTAQHSIIPLSTLAHAAMEATHYSPEGTAVIVESGAPGIGNISVHPLSRIGASPIRAVEPCTAIALIFPGGRELATDEVAAAARALDAAGEKHRKSGGSWDTVVAYGGVRFRIYSPHGWLDEPETDLMQNDRLDDLIAAFSGPGGGQAGPFDITRAADASDQWLATLRARLEDTSRTGSPAEGSLQAGAVRDAVIVWAVGDSEHDRLAPGERFIPPNSAPSSARIDAALAVLSERVGASDTVHALACASYLAWWSGYPRFAAHLYYRVRSTGQRSRLATLVWTALIRDISPHWMR